MSRRYIAEVTRAAVLEELRNGIPARELSRKYGISESSVSRWKKEANIDGKHAGAIVRSKPLPKSDNSVDSEDSEETSGRRGMLKRMIGLVNNLAEDGGLKSHDIRNLAQASKALAEADAKLEKEEQARVARERPKGGSDYATLVSLHPDGTPRNIAALFSTLDIQIARAADDREAEESAKDRLRTACQSAGLSPINVPFDQMISVASEQHAEKDGSAPALLEDAEGPLEYEGQGLA